jgi:hypothetical protein
MAKDKGWTYFFNKNGLKLTLTEYIIFKIDYDIARKRVLTTKQGQNSQGSEADKIAAKLAAGEFYDKLILFKLNIV